MFDIKVMDKIGRVQGLIAEGNRDQARVLLDELAEWFEGARPSMNRPEELEFLGGLADLYSQAGATECEIPLWEALCPMAKRDLEELGIMASSENVIMTAFDFLRLGRAYRKVNRADEARAMFEESSSILREVDMEPNIDELLTSDGRVLVGNHGGKDFFVT